MRDGCCAADWAGKMLFVGEALKGEVVGLRQITDNAWSLLPAAC